MQEGGDSNRIPGCEQAHQYLIARRGRSAELQQAFQDHENAISFLFGVGDPRPRSKFQLLRIRENVSDFGWAQSFKKGNC